MAPHYDQVVVALAGFLDDLVDGVSHLYHDVVGYRWGFVLYVLADLVDRTLDDGAAAFSIDQDLGIIGNGQFDDTAVPVGASCVDLWENVLK